MEKDFCNFLASKSYVLTGQEHIINHQTKQNRLGFNAPICHTISVPLCDRYLNWWFSNYPIFQSSFPGVSLEALCTPRSGELSSSQLCHCLSALKALLDNVWCREQLSSQRGIMIEICKIMHRQLLTQVQCSVDWRIFKNFS